MKIFKIIRKNGRSETGIYHNKSHASRVCHSVLNGYGISKIEDVPSKTMTQIAEEVGLPVKEVIMCFRGLMGRPEFRKGNPDLEEYWDDVDSTQNLLTMDHAEIFKKRLQEHKNKIRQSKSETVNA